MKTVFRFAGALVVLALLLVLLGLAPGSVSAQGTTRGLFVTDMRLTPAQLTHDSTISFFPAFLNNTETVQNFRWRVFIFRADRPWRSLTETTFRDTSFAVGSGEYPTIGTFRLGTTTNLCDFMFARVGWIDADSRIFYFTKPDGQVFEKGFFICDPKVLPTLTAAPTATPSPTPMPGSAGPGLYVSDMRFTPDQPTYNQAVSFAVKFNNTTPTLLNLRWRVYIFRADTPWRSNTETTFIDTGFPTGTGEYAAMGTFRYGVTGSTCDFFFARVGWVDADNRIYYFAKDDGRVFEKGFAVCDSRVIPSPTPGPTAAPSPTPRPDSAGAGLFVTNIKVDPSQPHHNQAASFAVTFNNKTTSVQNFRWRVYIFRVDTPWRSNTETTFLGTSFPVGSNDIATLGTFRYGVTGFICDFFFARVGWVDADNKIYFFTDTDGRVYEKTFSVCE